MNTILVCEDEAELRLLISQYLKKNGFEVLTASCGEDCLQTLKTVRHVDLVLLDVIMPGIDGFETLRQIRKMTTIPVIMLTACKEERQKVEGLELGADDYVVKPFSFKEVLSRIGAQLRRNTEYARLTEDIWLENGPLRMHLSSQEVQFHGVSVALSAKERALLKHFLNHIGVVFTKQQIYEAIWQEPYYDNDNTLMVHLSHLREKIEANPKQPEIIKTIRCVGYRMERLQ